MHSGPSTPPMAFKPMLPHLAQPSQSPFRPGSIFYSEPPTSHSPAHDDKSLGPVSSIRSNAHNSSSNEKRPLSTNLKPPAAVPLASPPPSPSRNSIFDQPWSTTAGPNITSLRASSSQTLSPSSTRRGRNATTTTYNAKIAHTTKDSNRNSTDDSHGQDIGLGQSVGHSSSDHVCSGIESPTLMTARTSVTIPPAAMKLDSPQRLSVSRIGNNGEHDAQKMLLSPVHMPRPPPSPSTSPSSPSPSLHLPPSVATHPSRTYPRTSSSSSKETTAPNRTSAWSVVSTDRSTFTVDLDRSKHNLLGHGRHAEVYRALIHPSSAPMKEYLAARKAASSVSCMDLLQETKDAAHQETFVCAAKCLFEDAESQAVGLAEADILKQLHAHPTTHPGRQSIVDFFGLYDQNSKQGSFVMEDLEPGQGPSDERQEGLWTLLLEYCQHGSVWDWIRQHPERVGFSQWLTWSLQLLEAVDFIHESGLVHHDIKPHNILLNSSLGVKLSDFGASRFLAADTGRPNGPEGAYNQTPSSQQFGLHEGLGRGTPPYSAPEMFASASSGAHYGQAIDIYSLGVSLYVIGLTAQEPFHKLKSVMEMIVWIKKGGFWLWEDQNWIHDRGPIPKATPSSRLSNSAAALALAQGQGQGQGQGSGAQGRPKSGLSRSSSTASLAPVPNLPPINTQLYLDGSSRGQSSASSINSPGAAGVGTTQHSHLRESPMSVPQGLGGQFLAGYSPEPPYRHSQPSTPVSPLPFPSPVIRAQSSRASLRKEESRKSGEIVMRFLNGEAVPPNAIQLLKDMCQADPAQRPTAKQVLWRLQEMKAALDAEAEADEDMDITGGDHN